MYQYIKESYISMIKFDINALNKKNDDDSIELDISIENKYMQPKDTETIHHSKLVVITDIQNSLNNTSVLQLTMEYVLSTKDNSILSLEFIKNDFYPTAYEMLSKKIHNLTEEIGIEPIDLPDLEA